MFQSKSFQALVLAIVALQMPMAIATADDYPRAAYTLGTINQEGGGSASGDPDQNSGGVAGECRDLMRGLMRCGCMSLIFRIDAFPEEEGLLKWTLARNDFGGEHGLGVHWGRPAPYLVGGYVSTPPGGGISTSAQVIVSGGALEYFSISGSSPDLVASPILSDAANVALHEGAADEWTYSFRDKQSGALQQYEFTWDADTAYGTSKCEKHIDEHDRETTVTYNTGGTSLNQVANLRRVDMDDTAAKEGSITEVVVGYYTSGHADDYIKYAVLRRAYQSVEDVVDASWPTWGPGGGEWADSHNIRRVRYYYYDDPSNSNDNDYGEDGTLKMVVVQKPAVASPSPTNEAHWTNVKVWYFRNFESADWNTRDGMVTYIVEPAWFARMDSAGEFDTNGVFHSTTGELLTNNDLDAMSDGDLADYATHAFAYDGTDIDERVSKGCSGGGGEDMKDYITEAPNIISYPLIPTRNDWVKRFTIESKYEPAGGGSTLRRRTTSYTNTSEQVLLRVVEEFADDGTTRISRTGDFYQFATSGHITLHAENSAIAWSDIDTAATSDTNGDGVTDWRDVVEYDATYVPPDGDRPDLMDLDSNAHYTWLEDAAGMIHHYEYAASTSGGIDEDTTGNVKGYRTAEKFSIGDGGAGGITKYKLREFLYLTNGATNAWETTYVLGQVAEYPDKDDQDSISDAYVTTYSYTWDGTNEQVMTERNTVRPIVTGEEPSSALTFQEQFNSRGLPTWSREYYDADPDVTYEITYRLYDIEQNPLKPVLVIRDFDTTCTEVTTEPDGWTTSAGYGMQLETKYVYDDFGRVIEEIGPRHAVDISGTLTAVRTVRFAVYKEFSESRHDEIWTAIGNADCDNSGTWPYDDDDYTYTGLVGPITVTRLCKMDRVVERMTVSSDSASSVYTDAAPTNKLDANDTVAIGTYGSPANNDEKYAWSQTHMDMQGRIDWQKTYHNIPATDILGSAGTNYTSLAYTYDSLGRTKAWIFLPDADPATAANLLDEDNRFTFTFYGLDSTDTYKEVRTYNDCYYTVSGTVYKMAGVADVAWYGDDGQLVRTWTGSKSTALAETSDEPDGSDTLTEESRTVYGYDSRDRPSYMRRYYDIATKYVESGVDEYDNLGGVVLRYAGVDSEDASTNKDITESVYDGLGRVTKIKIGTTSGNVQTVTDFYYDSNGSAADGTPQPRLKTRSDLGAAVNLTTFADTDFTEQVVATGSNNLRVRYFMRWTEPELGPWVKRISTGIAEVVVEERTPGSYSGAIQSGIGIRPERGDRIGSRRMVGGGGGTHYIETARYEYEGGGRVSKVTHTTGSFSKFEYDDVGHILRTTLATDDSPFTSIEEAVNIYDNYGNVVKRALYRRDDDSDTTAALCSNISTIPANGDHAQTSYVYTWYDEANRVTDVVNYGVTTTPGDTSPPAYSATHITTSYAYYPTGQVDEVQKLVDTGTTVDTKYYYDDLGRTEYIVENEDDFVAPTTGIGGDDGEPHIDRVTKFEYNGHSQLTKQTALLTSNSQTTRYVYARELTDKGTPKSGGTNIIFRNDLLRAIIYPDSADTYGNPITGTDHVDLTYYVNGALRTRTDQNVTVHTYDYDDIGRLTEDEATTLGTGVDGFVRSIGYTYNTNSGRLDKVTSAGNTDGTSIRNEIAFTHNVLGGVLSSEQAHGGDTSGSEPTVSYTYDTASTQGHITNGARLTQVTYPTNSRVVAFDYGTADGDNDMLSRIGEIENSNGSTVHAQYAYLGAGAIINVTYPGVTVSTNPLELTYGTADDNYPGLDPFGRVEDQLWQISTANTHKDRFEYTYDVRSNRLTRDVMPEDGVGDTLDDHDGRFTYDDLNRLIRAEQGTLEAGSFTLTARDDFWGKVETGPDVWALSPTGNWDHYHLDANGNGSYTEAGDLDQVRLHNKVNEIDTNEDDADNGNVPPAAAITEVSGQTIWATPGYNKAGNMDVMPVPAGEASTYALTYDAWNRLVEVKAGETVVTQYRYDGRHRRIAALEFVASDNWTRTDFYYDTAWRVVEECRAEDLATSVTAGDNNDKEDVITNVYAQYVWDLRYIDALVLRDRDSDGDQSLDETLYYCNDANMNVTALIDDSGTVMERYEYTPYGQVSFMDGSFGSRANSSYDNRILFAGYRFDSETGLYHVRLRYHHPTLGRWITRDPVGYQDGMNLYEYVKSAPTCATDPSGLGDDCCDLCLQQFAQYQKDCVTMCVGGYHIAGCLAAMRKGCEICLAACLSVGDGPWRHIPAAYDTAARATLIACGVPNKMVLASVVVFLILAIAIGLARSAHFSDNKERHADGVRMIESSSRALHRLTWVAVLATASVSALSCSERQGGNRKFVYRITPGAYSVESNRMLFSVSEVAENGASARVTLGCLDLTAGRFVPLHLEARGPVQFAWKPGKKTFVVAHDGQMAVFHEANADLGYTGRALSVPLRYLYSYCSWSPSGRWLAVQCIDCLGASTVPTLGVWDDSTSEFFITDIPYRSWQPPHWDSDRHLWIPNRDEAIRVAVTPNSATPLASLPFQKDGDLYGVVDGRVLARQGEMALLGESPLGPVKHGDRNAVFLGESYIFLSASTRDLAVFDLNGNEIVRAYPEKTIVFGAAGNSSEVIYGLMNVSILCRISVDREHQALRVERVFDLARFVNGSVGACPD